MAQTDSSDQQIIVVINGIHGKSGGGVTYLRRVLEHFTAHEDIIFHLFLHKDQLELFYPIDPAIRLTVFDFKPTFFSTFIWEQCSLPIVAWAMGANVVFSPANYGPVFARNHVSLLRNAVSVIRLIDRIQPALYWIMLAIATFITFLTAKRSIAVSNYASRILTFGLPGIFKKKLSVVYHGVTHGRIAREDNEKDGNVVLAVSDIYVQKNYLALVEAFAHVVGKYPDLELWIAGREIDVVYGARVRALAADLGIEERVKFLGHLSLEEVEELYRTCHIFVFPSFVETFGNPLVEAMSVGAPIACSNTTAMPEVLGDAGLLFDPHNRDEIAQAIETLHTTPSLRRELGQRALNRSKKFTWEACAAETVRVLRSAAEPIPESKRQFR